MRLDDFESDDISFEFSGVGVLFKLALSLLNVNDFETSLAEFKLTLSLLNVNDFEICLLTSPADPFAFKGVGLSLVWHA